jgi:biopolymer transport protein ExbD
MLETTDAAGLKAALQLLFANGRNLPLILRADGRTPHQAVVTVLEVAGQLGLKQLAIAITNDPSTVPIPSPQTRVVAGP